jgi:hypothetical protein
MRKSSEMPARLQLDRSQILTFRRRVNGLDERLPRSRRALRRIAWAGLQDSMPRAALLSIHARMEHTNPDTWEDSSYLQVWGPRFNAYVVAKSDLAVFTLGRLPEEDDMREGMRDLAVRLRALLGDAPMTQGAAASALGLRDANTLRYAATTGMVVIRWDGARQPVVWAKPPPEVNPGDAHLELARRYLHVFGPAAPEGFAQWAGLRPRRRAHATIEALRPNLIPVGTPIGEAWILKSDEPAFRAAPSAPAPARLLPSGDAYFLLQGTQRELLVVEEHQRKALWPSRVWPGALLLDGEIVGTWRRQEGTLTVQPWCRLCAAQRASVESEAASMPISGIEGNITVRWEPR